MSEIANILQALFLSQSDAECLSSSYAQMGISQPYDWQGECIRTSDVASGSNLVYCTPTGGGKTLVAELIIFRSVIALRKKAIFVLPYVSL